MDGVVGEVVGIVAIRMTRTRWGKDPLANHVLRRVCRIFSASATFVGQTSRRTPMTKPYTRSAELEGRYPAARPNCGIAARQNVAERGGLSKRSGNRTVCDIVSGVTQPASVAS